MGGSINNLSLKDFAQMVRMSDGGNFKTSVDKTSGSIYADKAGKIHNVRMGSFAKGDAAGNLQIRQQLANAFSGMHPTEAFVKDLRTRLGLSADGGAAEGSDTAFKPLSRREVKQILQSFNANEIETKGPGGEKVVSPAHEFTSATVTEGAAEGWSVIDTRTVPMLRLQAKEAMATLKADIPEGQRQVLEKQIANESPENLQRMVECFRKGNIDPLPFGNGRRTLPMPRHVADSFKKEISDSLKAPAKDDDSVLAKITADINREWTVNVGGKKLPSAKETANQRADIATILNSFFTEDERKSGVANKILIMVNQQIYTPLSMMPMYDGSIPGGVTEDARNDIDSVGKTVSVSRTEEGNVRVTFVAHIQGFNLVDSDLNATKGGSSMYLDGRRSNFRETSVSYDVIKDANGNLDLKFHEEPEVSYQYGRLVPPDEVKTKMLDKIDDFLAGGSDLAWKVADRVNLLRSELEGSIKSDKAELEKGHPKLARVKELRQRIEISQDKLTKLENLNEGEVTRFIGDPKTRERLVKYCEDTHLMPLNKNSLGRWDEKNMIAALYGMFTGAIE